MESQEYAQQKKSNKKQSGVDWSEFAFQFGTIALQGLVGGMASVVGAHVASRAMGSTANAAREVASRSENLVRIGKAGAA